MGIYLSKCGIKTNKLPLRILIYIVGLFIMSIGIALSINAGLGVSPVNVLPYVLSLVFHSSLGNCIFFVYCVFIFLQIVIKRKDFNWINLFQIVFAYIQASFTDIVKNLMGDFRIPTYLGQLSMEILGAACLAIGISLYLDAGLIVMPTDGLVSALSEASKKIPFHQMKVIFDCSCVILAVSISLLFHYGLSGVREGTVIAALLVGTIMGQAQKWLKPHVEQFLQ